MLQVYKAQQVGASELAPHAGQSQRLAAPEMLRLPDAAGLIQAHQGLASVLQLLMARAEADVALGLRLGETLCPCACHLCAFCNILQFTLFSSDRPQPDQREGMLGITRRLVAPHS